MFTNTTPTVMKRAGLFCGAVAALSTALLSCPRTPARANDTPLIITTQRQIAKPDLIVSDVLPYYEYVYPTGWVLVKDKLNVQIYNNGNGDAKSFTVLSQWGMGYSYQQQYFSFIGLKSGKSQWIVVDSNILNPVTQKMAHFDFSAPGAPYQVVVDLGNAVNEWDETNNVYNSPTP